ncbi:MAG: hypothetical protein EOO93_04325 [Pedobacter sp.]|nr:MAG: hypothetical protein EOO93_04325 [Pedobacter sp.]
MQPSDTQPTAEQIATMHQQWQQFIGAIASQAKLVNVSRLGFEGTVIKSDQSTKNKFFVESGVFVSGNLTMKAETIEQVIDTAKLCPVLFSGGTVEVRPTIPMN